MTIAEARRLKLLPSQTKKPSKYHNRRTLYEGTWFDSKKEAQRAFELDVLCKTGEVLKYETQVAFRIEHNGVRVCKYLADFVVTYADGRVVVEDVKSEMTRKLPTYRLKRKLVKAFHDVDIIEI